MICYRDMTFCPFYSDCSSSSECGRALTPEVVRQAHKWWGDESAPIAQYGDKPECWKEIVQH